MPAWGEAVARETRLVLKDTEKGAESEIKIKRKKRVEISERKTEVSTYRT